MALTIGNTHVKAVYVGSTPVRSVYVGSKLVWSATVQITLGTGLEARNQLRAALTARGMNYATVTEIPFEIELVGTGSAHGLFWGCSSLTSVPDMDTSNATDMSYMFIGCSALTSVPDMDTSQVTDMSYMFQDCAALTHAPDVDTSNVTNMDGMFSGCRSLTYVPDMNTGNVTGMFYMFLDCAALTDGNVRLIGRHPNVITTEIILGSGLTREPWYNADGAPVEVHEVSLTNVYGRDTAHPLVSVTVPAGETWSVRIQGTITKASTANSVRPRFRIGATDSERYAQGAAVDFSGTVTAANSTIAFLTNDFNFNSFTGTVTIEK